MSNVCPRCGLSGGVHVYDCKNDPNYHPPEIAKPEIITITMKDIMNPRFDAEKKLRLRKWDRRFLALAEHVSHWSKDPSTKCGAVIVRPDRTVVSLGYNGFPRGIEDKDELYNNREEKYKRVVHSEMNAILNAREPLHGYTLYVYPFMTCERCAVHVIQAGIKRVVAPVPTEAQEERWGKSFHLAQLLYDEAGVHWTLL